MAHSGPSTTEQIQALLNQDNLTSIKATLANLQVITSSFAEHSQQLIQSTTSTMSILQRQTLPATYQLLTQLNQTARNLSEITADIKQNPSILIRGVNRQPLGPGENK